MTKKTKIISIVGCIHYKGNMTVEGFLNSLMEKIIVLKPEPDNPKDSTAVVAIMDGQTVGYVRASEKNDLKLFDILNGTEHKLLLAKPKAINPDYKSLIVELDYDDTDSAENEHTKLLRQWEYTGIILDPPMKMKQAEESVATMLELLEKGVATEENMRYYFNTFKECAVYVFSCEFGKERERLQKMLENYPDPQVRAMAEEQRSISQSIHNSCAHYNAFCELKKDMKKQASGSKFKTQLLALDKKRLTREIEAFPGNFYSERNNVKIFASKLYYKFLPRDILMKFLSGMAILGILGKGTKKTVAKVKRKRGRPRLKKGDRDFSKLINGNSEYRELWIEQINQMIFGKKGIEAGLLMRALCKKHVISKAPYDYVKEKFGDIGSEKNYNKGLNNENLDNNEQGVLKHWEDMIESKDTDIKEQMKSF